MELPRAVFKALVPPLSAPKAEADSTPIFNGPVQSLSIIIPAHNEEKHIARCIDSVLEADYPRKEIIVVDDGSTDETSDVILPYARKGLVKLVRRETCSGKRAAAVDFGLAFATGDIVIAIDADTLIERSSLRRILAPLSDSRIGATAGNVEVLNRSNLLSKLQAYEYLMTMETGRPALDLTRTLMIISGAFGAFRKRLLRSVGDYDVDNITEDFDLTIKILKTGYRIKFCENAVAWTVVPDTWRKWIRQRSRWAQGELQTLWKHRNLFFKRRFGIIGFLAAPDMVFMDMLLLFLRMAWIAFLVSFFPQSMVTIALLVVVFYLGLELALFGSAAAFKSRLRDGNLLACVPVMVLLYRPIYSLVRLNAYVQGMFGKKATW